MLEVESRVVDEPACQDRRKAALEVVVGAGIVPPIGWKRIISGRPEHRIVVPAVAPKYAVLLADLYVGAHVEEIPFIRTCGYGVQSGKGRKACDVSSDCRILVEPLDVAK